MPSTSGEFDFDAFAGVYFDGESARRHAVRVTFTDTDVEIAARDGAVVDRWPYDVVDLSDQGRDRMRLMRRDSPARLEVRHPQAFAALSARMPTLLSQDRRALRNVFVAVGLMLVVVIGGYLALPVAASAVVALIPFDTEARIGRTYAERVVALFSGDADGRVCWTDLGRGTLDKIVVQLEPYRTGPFQYQVDVIDNPQINALALPGGRIFILRGVLDEAEHPNEVAAVIAHEMAHVDARHGMHAVVRNYGLSLLGDLMFGGSMMGDVSSFAMFTAYSREAEQQADASAIDTLKRTGFGTAWMAAFFHRLREKEQERGLDVPAFMSTHPDSAAREDLAKGVHAPTRKTALSDWEWRQLKGICDDPSGS